MDKLSVPELPFTRRNWVLFAVALAIIALGYVLLSIPPADGFFSLTLAPLLLVVGSCVLVPVAILMREAPAATDPAPVPARKAR